VKPLISINQRDFNSNTMAAVSVGDCLAILKLIKDISTALSDTNGARDEYASICGELQSLETAVRNAQDVIFDNPRRNRDLRRALSGCRDILEKQSSTLLKYKAHLRPEGSGNWASDAFRQIQFAMRRPETMRRFKDEINARMTAITIIMNTANQ